MVATDNGPESVFVAGYQTLTDAEFAEHYRHRIDEAIEAGHCFLLSDEAGTCLKTFEYLLSKNVSASTIRIFTNEEVNQGAIHLPVVANTSRIRSVPGGDTERYARMAAESEGDIIWLRPGDSLEDNGCISGGDVMNMRFTGAKEAVRAVGDKHMREVMAYYDTIV